MSCETLSVCEQRVLLRPLSDFCFLGTAFFPYKGVFSFWVKITLFGCFAVFFVVFDVKKELLWCSKAGASFFLCLFLSSYYHKRQYALNGAFQAVLAYWSVDINNTRFSAAKDFQFENRVPF